MVQHTMRLKVGDVAPAFTLPTGDGRESGLTDVLRSKTAILVFIRGTW